MQGSCQRKGLAFNLKDYTFIHITIAFYTAEALGFQSDRDMNEKNTMSTLLHLCVYLISDEW